MKTTYYESVKNKLKHKPKTWLVTGCAGFIGSHLVETLLHLNQRVIGIDNLSACGKNNLIEVKKTLKRKKWKTFKFIKGDISKVSDLKKAIKNLTFFGKSYKTIDIILHQAALGSVPRSFKIPAKFHRVNVTGTFNLLKIMSEIKTKRLIYASSSSVYGDSPTLPRTEEKIGAALSPYALSKQVAELYAKLFGKQFGYETIGLRYFNVFGPRQNPNGEYAAVIPRWINEFLSNKTSIIFGDGKTTRDFCYVEDIVQANILAATTGCKHALNSVFNIACGKKISLLTLYNKIKLLSKTKYENSKFKTLIFKNPREGDVVHSKAKINRAKTLLKYKPSDDFNKNLQKTFQWFKLKLLNAK